MRKADLASLLRVDHAGEHGAVRIYDGQLAIFGKLDSKKEIADEIRHMATQEDAHLEAFDTLLTAHEVRPTALSPLWNVAGFALGAATALMGEKAAMACTEAVEEVIDAHYAEQLEILENEPEHQDLAAKIRKFREDEIAHRDTARAHGAEDAPGYKGLSAAIKTGCHIAIALSKRI